jgi:murein DD-endopeptidase MepM/ murein hydrolase activator NlpD
MTTSSLIQRGARRRTLLSVVPVAIAATAATSITLAFAPARDHITVVRSDVLAPLPHLATVRTPASRPYSYGWPVKPFDRQHPVRGNFGDPRTTFDGGPLSACDCSFHQGIDISAPDGTAVYALEAGVVRTVTREWVQVDGGHGHAFQYWHVHALVHEGDHVEKQQTVIGRIIVASEHVHLTELQDGRPVNPLAPGHIGPYADTTTPRVTSISFRTSDTGRAILPELVHGNIEIVAAAQDSQSIPAPGIWKGLPVTPAKVSFRIERVMPKPARLVVRETVARDVTERLPTASSLWTTYARGSYMNMPNFATHRYWLQPGSYLFDLTPALLSTRSLGNGVFRITVTATDTAGNAGSSSQLFSVHNDGDWLRG